ncbi:S8 family peptidase [Chitinimonas sp.]|uniref:S8 family peptidase n=1 Tax=Chitinimonas sp. TaxID=1934313 RepID=UPI0035B10187
MLVPRSNLVALALLLGAVSASAAVPAATSASVRNSELLAQSTPQPAAARPAATDYADRLIVKYKSGTSGPLTARALTQHAQSLQSLSGGYKVQVRYMRRLSTGGELFGLGRTLPVAQAFKLARHLMRQDPNIAYAEPDVINKTMALPSGAPNDPLFEKQWDLYEPAGGLNVLPAWERSRGQGVVVAVLDTGYRPHADLAANVLPGYDFIGDLDASADGDGRDADASDAGDDCGRGSSWHGTHVAGTIAALAGNGVGVAGIAPAAKILPVRVLGKCGGHTSDIVDGLAWATGASVDGVPANTTPARVVNMSLGSGVPCLNTYREAMASAYGRGAIVVVAAGNGSHNVRNVQPASCPGVISVAATNRAGGRAYYSNYGGMVTVAAPGGELFGGEDSSTGILSTYNDGKVVPGNDSYGYEQGTSMAAPHVAGVVALMLSVNPKMTPDQVRQVLTSTSRNFPAACAGCGAGIVDAAAAVAASR